MSKKAEKFITLLKDAVNQQAKDEGIWFVAQTAPEGYLQQELRRLHALIEEYEPATEDLITVCDACLMASCWQGIFMCDRSQGAGTVQKTRSELRQLGLEHPRFWKTDLELVANTGRKN